MAGMDEELNRPTRRGAESVMTRARLAPSEDRRAGSASGSQRRGDLFIFRSTQMAGREAALSARAPPGQGKEFLHEPE